MNRFILKILFFSLIGVSTTLILPYSFRLLFEETTLDKLLKISTVRNNDFDIIFIGSSRVNRGVNTSKIKKEMGLNVINYGIDGFNLNMTNYILEDFFHRGNNAEYIFVQVDFQESKSNRVSDNNDLTKSMFSMSKNLIKKISTNSLDYLRLMVFRNYTFFKYNDQFLPRAFLLVKGRTFFDETMFTPVNKDYNYDSNHCQKIEFNSNDFIFAFDKIKKTATKYNSKLIPFTISYTNKRLDNISNKNSLYDIFKNEFYYNGVRTVTDQSYFYDDAHLNHIGANIYTDSLISKIKKIRTNNYAF